MPGKQLVEFQLEDGSNVIFETAADDYSGDDDMELLAADNNNEPRQANEKFEKVASRIKPAAEIVLNALKELNSPSEIAIEFGVKFSAKTGVIFASADSEASFNVSIKWNKSNE